MRAKGDTKRPLYIIMISGVINVALNLFFVCAFGMGAGGVALATVQNFGAKRFDRIKKILFICLTYAVGLWAIESLITFFFGEFLIGLYTPGEPEVIEMGIRKFSLVGYCYGILSIMNIMSGLLRGMGASFINMITSIIGVCGIRLIWIATVFATVGTFKSLFWCYPVSWSGTTILHTLMVIYTYKKGKKHSLLKDT